MENEKIARRVKDNRKLKGLSQEELANKSGLSLRTVQRVENGETEPTGETLKRISAALDVTLNELIELGIKSGTPKKVVKTKYEYLNIFDTKLVISKNAEFDDLVEDYGKSVNNVFKTLMVFFIGIPIFTALTIIFYILGKNGLAIYAASFALLFLVVAFYTMLFTSGSSLIKMENISRIMIKNTGYNTSVVILHRESGRIKERSLLLENDQIIIMKDILLSEKLIEEKNINLKARMFSLKKIIVALIMLILFFGMIFKKIDQTMFYYGVIVVIICVPLIVKMILRSISPLSPKTTNR
ncbi:MAG: helix-turn-helix transcriptional regulator [Mariniphaga sp.]